VSAPPDRPDRRAGADAGVVLVTGSSGRIGYPTSQRLAERYAVVGFDRAGPPDPPPVAECVNVDVTSDASVRAALADVRARHGERIASAVHLAAYADFSGEESPKYEAITVRGTERLLRELRALRVEQFVFSSSMLVHGPCQPGQRIDEDWPVAPTWAYPRSKVRTEELLRAQHGDVPLVLLRIAGVYTDRCDSVPLAQQIARIFERRLTSRVFAGTTSHGQAFVHRDDVVEAIRRTVERWAELPSEVAILVGEPETLSYDELQHTLGRLIHGREWETLAVPKPLAKAGTWLQEALPVHRERFVKPWMIDRADDHYALDVSRARELLGWEPRRSLRETLPKMVAALKADPAGWYRANHLDPPARLAEDAAPRRRSA
jgi:nucleoside-diphosphate-sugar epimerase